MKESRMKMKRNARRRRRAVQSPGARDRSTEVCRLCHGQTPRSIAASHAPAAFPLFCSDFHRLLGVRMKRDPDLSRFICERCHEEFYRCQRVLEEFRRRANQRPDAHRSDTEEASSKLDLAVFRPLHSLVSWAHSHAAFGCSSCPDLREALRSRCGASVTLLWSCEDGHGFQIDTPSSNQLTDRELQQNEEEEEQQQQTVQRSEGSGDVEEQNYSWSLETQPCGDLSPPDAAALIHTEGADSELSDRILLSEEECEEQRRSSSCEEGNAHNHRGGCKEQGTLEPRPRRKPGPKPGWKNHSKALREELPTIFKCPHQGCTAVYRGADGMKKHIKEHHEEVRERPCPHPGCNKVFMIDRYLQRHLKLIHTEERNYICDQCGQTFKQRKHLSVHQMRHSGAKPLQCEVCGFQCRQRASLKYHMTKHKAEAELEFGCQICSKRFEKAHNLNVHMSMVHPLLQNTITEHSGPAQHADTHS